MATQAPVEAKVATPPRGDSTQILWKRVKALQDAYRTALLNRLYYGYRLATAKKWNITLEIILAIGTSTAIAAWALWKNETGEMVWATVSGLAALLAILKPILQFPKEIERYSKLFTEHGSAFYELEGLVGEVTRRQKVGPDVEVAFQKIQERLRALCSDDDPNPSKKLVQLCYDEVNEKIPVEGLWRPLTEEGG